MRQCEPGRVPASCSGPECPLELVELVVAGQVVERVGAKASLFKLQAREERTTAALPVFTQPQPVEDSIFFRSLFRTPCVLKYCACRWMIGVDGAGYAPFKHTGA